MNSPAWFDDPWEVTAWDVASGDEITSRLTPEELEGLKRENKLWGARSVGHNLPTTAINDLEQVLFHNYWCIRAFTSPNGEQAFTTHDDGRIRFWKRR